MSFRWDELTLHQPADPPGDTFARVLVERLSVALDHAQAHGYLELSVESSAAAALLLGPLYYRSTIEHAAVDEPLLEAAIASLGTWVRGPEDTPV
jgi:hypothetical protein